MKPDVPHILSAIDTTWPAARTIETGPWRIREGLGGGQRVSAATATGPINDADIDIAIKAMTDLNQTPQFMIRPEDTPLDAQLERRGFTVKDPVTAHIAPLSEMTGELPPVAVTPAWPPLSIQREIWAGAGIGPDRIAVMERADVPKITHLGRCGDVPAGTAFTAIDGDLAMLHALEVLPDLMRKGVGRTIMTGAANWAAAQGAKWLSVLVVNANDTANAFYESIGMKSSGFGYHYRRAPKDAS